MIFSQAGHYTLISSANLSFRDSTTTLKTTSFGICLLLRFEDHIYARQTLDQSPLGLLSAESPYRGMKGLALEFNAST
jgi:hypothetical protein